MTNPTLQALLRYLEDNWSSKTGPTSRQFLQQLVLAVTVIALAAGPRSCKQRRLRQDGCAIGATACHLPDCSHHAPWTDWPTPESRFETTPVANVVSSGRISNLSPWYTFRFEGADQYSLTRQGSAYLPFLVSLATCATLDLEWHLTAVYTPAERAQAFDRRGRHNTNVLVCDDQISAIARVRRVESAIPVADQRQIVLDISFTEKVFWFCQPLIHGHLSSVGITLNYSINEVSVGVTKLRDLAQCVRARAGTGIGCLCKNCKKVRPAVQFTDVHLLANRGGRAVSDNKL